MLSPVPAPIGRPAAVCAATSPGATTRGSRGSWPSAALARSGRQLALVGREVAGAGGVAAVGERGRCRARTGGGRRSRAGAAPRPPARRASGSWSRSQRSLVTVNEATSTLPIAVGARLRAAELLRSARPPAGADRVSFQSSASRTGSPSSPSATIPCCWPPTATASARSSRPAAASSTARQPGPRVDLGAGRVRARPLRHHRAVVGVDEQRLGGLRRGVDAQDEGHAPDFSTRPELMSMPRAKVGIRRG